jgi:ABC-2 type transport system permease protein
MSKIGLIIQREYWTRVRKRSFLIMTLLGPLLFAAIVIVPAWLSSRDSSGEKVIAVIDESGLLGDKLEESSAESGIRYEHVQLSLDEAKADLPKEDRYGLLYIPNIDIHDPQGINFLSEGNPSMNLQRSIERTLKEELRELRLKEANISPETLAQLNTDVNINTVNLTDSGQEQQGNADVASGVGYVSAFLIYMFIFLYGAQVMRGVIEEKTNRIVEIIISSVRPFQLMMGKIIGVASVGLTQFLLWIVLTVLIATTALQFFAGDRPEPISPKEMAQQMPEQAAQMEAVSGVMQAIDTVNVPLILGCFVFYFLGGYLLYSALFAAVGSAADNDTDTQQFMLPVAAPLIFSIVTLAGVLNEPDGPLAVWMSMIPLTSPVTMMMRIPFGVPTWQLIASMVLLVLGFVGTTWVAAKIYRIGILTYGSKVSYKTLGKWLFS